MTALLSGIRREFCPHPVFPSLLLGIFVSSLLPRQHISTTQWKQSIVVLLLVMSPWWIIDGSMNYVWMELTVDRKLSSLRGVDSRPIIVTTGWALWRLTLACNLPSAGDYLPEESVPAHRDANFSTLPYTFISQLIFRYHPGNIFRDLEMDREYPEHTEWDRGRTCIRKMKTCSHRGAHTNTQSRIA